MPRRVQFANPDAVLSHALRGRAWMYGAALGLVMGGALYVSTPPEYRSTAAVEVSEVAPSIDLDPLTGRERLLSVDTDAQLLVSDEVVAAVAKASGEPRSWVRRSVSVTGRSLTRVLEITYTGRSPKTAQAGANAAADSLLAVRQRLVIAPVEDYLSEVALRTEAPLEAEVLAVDERIGASEFRVESWRERALEAKLALPDSGVVLQRALFSTGPRRGDPEVPLASGACLGALVAVVARLGRRRIGVVGVKSAWQRRFGPNDGGHHGDL